ncbi:MAG: ubiquinol-cytochrome c reductase iron-sulfur subunit [Planctomycetaceae bacterium]|nr:MAG: ubiquinol-cytochrome c reductase iron-sulfur subunit [Planctomycetaceae bacterium]
MMLHERTSRRDFLCLGAAAAAAACGGCAILGSRKADVTAEPKQGVIRLTGAQSATLLASEGSTLVKPKGLRDKILVVHLTDNALLAVSAICTHQGCTVNYNKDMGRIDCPCHGSQYAPDGSVIRGPAKRPLKQYEVTTEGGQVLIML